MHPAEKIFIHFRACNPRRLAEAGGEGAGAGQGSAGAAPAAGRDQAKGERPDEGVGEGGTGAATPRLLTDGRLPGTQQQSGGATRHVASSRLEAGLCRRVVKEGGVALLVD